MGLRRTWDLRSYTGQALALLTGRRLAYGYRHMERFLAELAQVGADATLTETSANWTASPWKRPLQEANDSVPIFYIDGQTPCRLRRSPHSAWVGGTPGKSRMASRALVLLHDQAGQPLLVTTHRGDQHLTIGLPTIITHYEQAAGLHSVERVVVDREGMAAEFLAALARRRTCRDYGVANGPIQRIGVIPRGRGVCPIAR